MREAIAAAMKRGALLTIDETSDYLGVPVATLYVWRSRGKGPRSSKVGRYVRYRLSDIDAWLDRQSSGGAAA